MAMSRSVVVADPTNFSTSGRTTTPVIAKTTNAIPASVNRKVVA
jgi:hypothetical protein